MKKRTIKITLFFLGVLILILLLLPGIAKRYIINHSKELTGRQIQIDKLKYNYFTSTIKVFNFKMFEENEQDKFVSFDTLIVNLEPLQLIKDKIEIEQFYLQGLNVNVVMKDSLFNFRDLIEFHAVKEDSMIVNENTEDLFKYSISKLELKDANLFFDNQNVDIVTNVEDLSFLIPYIGWDQEEKSNADVKFNFKKGGYFETKLNINPVNGEYNATVIINNLFLDPFHKYTVEYADINSLKGRINSTIYIEGNTSEVINSTVSGKVEVSDFNMTDTNNEPFFAVKKAAFVLKEIDVTNGSYILDSLNIEEPYVSFKMDSLSNNLSKIFLLEKELNSINKELITIEKSDSIATNTLNYTINHFEISNGNIAYSDNLMGSLTNYNFSNIKVNGDSLSNNRKWGHIQSEMTVNEDGFSKVELDYHPINENFKVIFNSQKLKLDPFYKYISEYANINTIEGDLKTNLSINGNINEVEKVLVSGLIEVSDFSMLDNQDKKFIASKSIVCNLDEIDIANNSYRIDNLKIIEPYLYFEMDSITNNISKIFYLDDEVEDEKVATENNSDSEKELFYSINHFEINNGVTDYTDNLTGTPFNYHLSAIKMNTNNVVSNSEWVEIKGDMLLNNRGTLVAELSINPSNPMYTNLNFSIEKFLLSDINIYTNFYMGHTILEGDMYYYSNSIITNGVIESENNLLVKNVSLNNTEKGLYNLPLKFALFLLKDKNGDVNLDIPVGGDLNDPTINVNKMIWTAFKNLIVKAATSPGRLLAGLVGGDPKDIEEINFSYLDSIPSVKNYKQLDKLLELEQKKEGLKIEMVYYVDKKLQKEAIAKEEAGKIYLNETQKDYLKNEQEFEAFILAKTSSDSLTIKQSYLAITNKNSIDSIAQKKSKSIISTIENYIKIAQDSTQIKVILSDPNAPENTGSLPTLKINFSLKDEE